MKYKGVITRWLKDQCDHHYCKVTGRLLERKEQVYKGCCKCGDVRLEWDIN